MIQHPTSLLATFALFLVAVGPVQYDSPVWTSPCILRWARPIPKFPSTIPAYCADLFKVFSGRHAREVTASGPLRPAPPTCGETSPAFRVTPDQRQLVLPARIVDPEQEVFNTDQSLPLRKQGEASSPAWSSVRSSRTGACGSAWTARGGTKTTSSWSDCGGR